MRYQFTDEQKREHRAQMLDLYKRFYMTPVVVETANPEKKETSSKPSGSGVVACIFEALKEGGTLKQLHQKVALAHPDRSETKLLATLRTYIYRFPKERKVVVTKDVNGVYRMKEVM
jgi:hypothetical protein